MGLTLTPSADTATKFIDWRTAVNGDADTSNAQIVDKAFGNLKKDTEDAFQVCVKMPAYDSLGAVPGVPVVTTADGKVVADSRGNLGTAAFKNSDAFMQNITTSTMTAIAKEPLSAGELADIEEPSFVLNGTDDLVRLDPVRISDAYYFVPDRVPVSLLSVSNGFSMSDLSKRIAVKVGDATINGNSFYETQDEKYLFINGFLSSGTSGLFAFKIGDSGVTFVKEVFKDGTSSHFEKDEIDSYGVSIQNGLLFVRGTVTVDSKETYYIKVYSLENDVFLIYHAL